MLPHVLLVIDRSSLRTKLSKLLSRLDAIVHPVKNSNRMWERLSQDSGDFVLISRSLLQEPVDATVKILKSAPESPEIIVITVEEDVVERGVLLAAGCDAVLPEDIDTALFGDVFTSLVNKRCESERLKISVRSVDSEPRLSDFVSESPSMQAFMEVVERVVMSDTSLLILGETGVGKERLTRAIHAESHRSKGPFIAINCAALPEALLESELFGHEEGAFTGATRTRRGWFELAHGGTIFLDEIGEMPLHLQVKLLRVLQERELCPIGSEKTIPIDVRIVAATNTDLEAAVKQGTFRRDLFYRLSVVTLTLPPLRERREDISKLLQGYNEYYQRVIGRSLDDIDEKALQALECYSWPGNVRELANVVERAVLLCRTDMITLADLPENVSELRLHSSPHGEEVIASALLDPHPDREVMLAKTLRQVRQEVVARTEIVYIRAMLAKTNGRINETARLAGIQPRSLFEKMKRYNIQKEEFRQRKDRQ